MNLQAIIEAVRLALMLCREVQHQYLFSNTKTNSNRQESEPVTIADYGAQAIIGRAIKKHFPDDAVIAEEAGKQFLELVTGEQRAQILRMMTTTLDENVTQHDVIHWLDQGKDKVADRTWIIDPIDGTKGFLEMRHYAVAVGVVEAGKVVEGIVGCPGYGDGVSGYDDGGMIFFTQDGHTCRQPIAGGEATQVSVSDRTNPSELQIVQSFEKAHASKSRMGRVRELAGMAEAHVRELDSMEKYALVACGDADLYIRLPNLTSTRKHKVWDHAAGLALVEAAGGTVTDVDGSPLDFSQGATLPNKGMIVSNGQIHDAVMQATQKLIKEEA